MIIILQHNCYFSLEVSKRRKKKERNSDVTDEKQKAQMQKRRECYRVIRKTVRAGRGVRNIFPR